MANDLGGEKHDHAIKFLIVVPKRTPVGSTGHDRI